MNYPYTLTLALLAVLSTCTQIEQPYSIDREALVKRHIVQLTEVDTLSSLSVGNGDFAYTVDVSGLQSFYQDYENGVSLGTQSQWGWHAFPLEEDYSLKDVAVYDTSCTGQVIPFAVQHNSGRAGDATHALRTNPHRLHLGIVGMEFVKSDGSLALLEDLKTINQTLDPWTGKIESTYTIEGEEVKVELFGHQELDAISARVTSPLITDERLRVFMKFPYGSDCHVCPGYDFNSPEAHSTSLLEQTDQTAILKRSLDTTTYFTQINWSGDAVMKEQSTHDWLLEPTTDSFSFSVTFSPEQKASFPSFDETSGNSENQWEEFWTTGGVVDFSQCTDPRAKELERRVVLSQYLTKIQCSGDLPPQETGLTMNSWYGKFHLEMHWWHGVHWALWDRLPLLGKSLGWYHQVIDKARSTAEWQGFEGVRWQKMTDPYGDEGPSGVGVYLVWQQPHPIYYAELVYRQNPTKQTLDTYKDIVFESADFMADFAQKQDDGYYHLCAPVKPAQELFPSDETLDPPFEMVYWKYALSVAQDWRKRLRMEREPKWQEVIEGLAPLAIKDGLYLPSATHPMSYEDDFYLRDHPVVVGALGMLPESNMVNKETMQRTYDKIQQIWQWESTWGWDYPMLAMSAARLGNPEQAVDALFMDLQKNTYLPNGHNYQDERLRIYLPGNGGLLTAVAMMAAGWDGSTDDTPGFPDDGTWKVHWEGIKRMP